MEFHLAFPESIRDFGYMDSRLFWDGKHPRTRQANICFLPTIYIVSIVIARGVRKEDGREEAESSQLVVEFHLAFSESFKHWDLECMDSRTVSGMVRVSVRTFGQAKTLGYFFRTTYTS